MKSGRASDSDRELVRAADILGSFGVTPADIRAQRREYRTAVPPGRAGGDVSLESILADVLADDRDRTATVRQTVCGSDRGLTCSGRYAQRALGRELEAVFDAIGWSFEWTRTGPAANGRDRLELAATDPKGRTRETTVTYPTTPLADDNLPAVLAAITDRLLAGTDATFVLLSAGEDRWRAALIEANELEALRGRYGPRISAFDRPLLPEDGLEAYVPEGDGAEGSSDTEDSAAPDTEDSATSGPWPAWALERARRRTDGLEAANDKAASNETKPSRKSTGVASLIDEAEPESGPPVEYDSSHDEASATPDATTTAPSTEAGGFEIRGGSPTVSRVNDVDSATQEADTSSTEQEVDRSGRTTERSGNAPSDDGFGTLSGTSKTTRVTNDSFGTGDEFETQNDRYRAFGAALGAGGAVTVEGLLEDDEFVPELPAVESRSVRIEFDEEFDPTAVPEAKASGEQNGFEWVDSGTLETTRLSE